MFANHIYLIYIHIYIYAEDLALNNLQSLICQKTKPNQALIFSFFFFFLFQYSGTLTFMFLFLTVSCGMAFYFRRQVGLIVSTNVFYYFRDQGICLLVANNYNWLLLKKNHIKRLTTTDCLIACFSSETKWKKNQKTKKMLAACLNISFSTKSFQYFIGMVYSFKKGKILLSIMSWSRKFGKWLSLYLL